MTDSYFINLNEDSISSNKKASYNLTISNELNKVKLNNYNMDNTPRSETTPRIENISRSNSYIINNLKNDKNNNYYIDIENDFIPNLSYYSINNSNNNSNSGSDILLNYSSEDSYNSNNIKKIKKYKKLSYKDVEKSINRNYNINNKYSNEIDILLTYINGKKNIYIQSKNITQYKLNLLMIPSIIISAAITMTAPFIDCQIWTTGVISLLNAIVMLLLSLINYLKYESSIQNFLQFIKNYDKLLNSLEMANYKLDFIENEKDKKILILNKIREIEKKVNEIKDSNTELIPEETKKIFPIISNINIFSFIKKTEMYKKNLISKLRDVKNEIRYILYKWDDNNTDNIDKNKEKKHLLHLYEIKKNIKEEIIELSCAYNYIDNIFTKEISMIENNKWGICFFFYPKKKNNYNSDNPIIDKYFKTIIYDL